MTSVPTRAARACVVLAAVALLLAACGGGPVDAAVATRTAEAQPPAPSPSPTPSTRTAPRDRLADLAGRAPLTALPTDPADAAALARPAVTVAVGSEDGTRPAGVAAADVVWTVQTGATTTRLVAVFHSTLPDEVGPVRPALPTDGMLAAPTRGALASVDTPGWVRSWLTGVDLDDLGSPQGPAAGAYGTDPDRPRGDRTVVDVGALLDVGARTAPPAPLFAYAVDSSRTSSVVVGEPAGRVDLGYGEGATAWWTFEPSAGQWRRAQGGSPQLLADGSQVSATNVLVLHTTRDRTSFPEAGADEWVLDLDQAGGDLELLSGAHAVRGRWSKAGPEDPFVLVDAVGKPLLLAPGTTWVEVISETVPVVVGGV